jgi:zinc protease
MKATARAAVVIRDAHVRQPVWQRMSLAPSYHAGETQHVYALQVLGEILAGEAASRLHRQLVGEKRLATAVSVDYLPDSIDITDCTVQALPCPNKLVNEVGSTLEKVVPTGL